MFTANDLVSEVFHPIPFTASVEAAIKKLVDTDIEYLVAVNEAGPQAVISANMLLKSLFEGTIDIRNTGIAEIITEACTTIPSTAETPEIIQIIKSSRQVVFPVVDDLNHTSGVIHLREILALLSHNIELRDVYD